ncbi:MAG: AAA family ATPase [Oscillibacter sp.]|nr:AAA family ATPase [Oscillibacter sp.]
MQIKRLAATFGRLEQDRLELEPGLNVIEAPNESGKSTWTAFLRVMLYGLNTRDRGPNADKRRYLPWSGSAMEGVLEASTDLGDVTILRRTARANSPMGSFSAVYTGTADPVKDLTSTACGETLLGVPQDVFERSAYIRQTGLAVEQSKALEQRITSLVTTGEEDTSFTGAADQLRRQFNARRHNKTGLIPQLEEEQRAIRATLEQMDALTASAARSRQALDALLPQIKETETLLARHDAADQADELRKVESARADAAAARDRAKTLEANTRTLPARPDLEAIQGRIEALASINDAVDSARSRLDLTTHNLRQAEKALNAHAFAGLTPAEAASAPLETGPKPAIPRWLLPAAILAGLLLGGTVAYFTRLWLIAIGSGLGLFGFLLIGSFLFFQKKKKIWETNSAGLELQREEAVSEYTPLYEAEAEARAKQQAAQAAWEAVSASAATNLESILTQLRSFRPLVRDLPEACEALNEAFLLRGKLEQAQRREDEARHRWEALRDAAPPIPTVLAQRPGISREQLRLRLSDLQSQDASLRKELHTTLGRIQALGDPGELRLRLQSLEERRSALQKEYDAIALAMEVLALSNSTLQTRFSPALGERAASIFTNLTGGRYNRVLLDRSMTPSAQQADQLSPHEAEQLSQGTADQLYLAVRLAICEMVLPSDKAVPILLDDALVNFDDQRMAAALDYLLEVSVHHQILLFTCQKREGDYLNWAYPDRFHHIKL